ncbi:MAG: hypothetical protein GY940_15095 [bacterium]|nr:hypothetical protein [bacterium]
MDHMKQTVSSNAGASAGGLRWLPFVSRRKADIFYLSVILLVCVKFTYHVTGMVDVMLADESYYLEMGFGFKWNYLFRDGFIYFIWLKLLSLFIPDMVTAYCYNYALLISINPVLLYILARKMGRGYFLSALFAIFFLVSTFNIFTWPYITRFAIAVVLLTLMVIYSLEKKREKYLAALAGLLILIYIRPEFVLSFLLFAVVSVIILIRRYYRSRERKYGYLLMVTVIPLLFVIFLGNPASGQRSVMAFGQHYGANLQLREKAKLNPWTDWRQLMKERFGTDESLTAAFLNNPGELKNHIMSNTGKFASRFFYQMFPSFSGQKTAGFIKKTIAVFIIFLFMASGVQLVRYSFRRFKEKRVYNTDDKFLYALSVLILIPTLASLFIIYPRTHYMLVIFAVCCILMIRNFPKFPSIPKYDLGVKVAIAIVFLYLVPWKVSGTGGLLPGEVKEGCSYIKRILTIKEIPIQGEIRFLEDMFNNSRSDKYFQMYTRSDSKKNYTFFKLPADVPVREFIESNKINMIYVNRKLKNRIPMTSKENWKRYEVPGCKEYILVNLPEGP